MNVWLLVVPGLVLPFVRDESLRVLPPRLAAFVLIGGYVAYLARRPGWLPRA